MNKDRQFNMLCNNNFRTLGKAVYGAESGHALHQCFYTRGLSVPNVESSSSTTQGKCWHQTGWLRHSQRNSGILKCEFRTSQSLYTANKKGSEKNPGITKLVFFSAKNLSRVVFSTKFQWHFEVKIPRKGFLKNHEDFFITF